MTGKTICSAVKLIVLLGGGGEACFKIDAKEGVVLNSSTLKIMPVFWHTSPPKVVPWLVLGRHFLYL